MRDLFSQCTYVRTCLSCSGMSICARHGTHTSRNSYVMCTDTGEYRMPNDGGEGRTALLDNGGRVGQRGWSPAMYAFCGVEYRTQPTACQSLSPHSCKWLY